METVRNIYSHLGANGILLDNFPFQSEAVMEAFLCENPLVLGIEGLDEPSVIECQVQWTKDKAGKIGRIDMLVSFGSEYIAIVELKNECLIMEHVEQLESYLADKVFLKQRAESLGLESDGNLNWFGILVGTGIENKLLMKVLDGDFITKNDLPLGVILLSRFKGGGQSFILPTAYPPVLKNKPPLYEFNGKKDYKTSQLTHAMIKDYIEKHFNEVSFSKLMSMLGGVKVKKPVIVIWNEEKEKELSGFYYTKPDERIPLQDGSELAVLRWWYVEEIDKITKIADFLGCKFSKI